MTIDSPEPSPRPTFQDVVAARMSRRTVLQGGLAAAVTGFFGGAPAAFGQAGTAAPRPLLGFEAVPTSRADTVVVPRRYRFQVLLPWGEPISGSRPEFRLENTGAEQGMQIGMHHDGMHYFPIEGEHPFEGSSDDGLLVINHEYVEPRLMHAAAAGTEIGSFASPVDGDGFRDPDQVLKEINGHGVSITRIRRGSGGQWTAVRDPRNRRITAQTPMAIAGPVRGHDSVRTRYSPEGVATRGTMANCAHGVTPWNTYLTCEENWWYYFAAAEEEERPSFTRYRVGSLLPWRWHLARDGADEYVRFDAAPAGASAAEDYRNEPHCVGWVVEIDPFDPDSTPVKRTHLGRCSHEGAVFAPVREGEPVVVYTGDDVGGQFIYKFVSSRPYRAATADGSLLDEGTLYAARFDDDGSGQWLALAPGENSITAEAGFPDLASVLIDARGAGALAGATPMDRPEWGAVDPVTGDVYFSLTNNSRRTEANAANPRTRNVYGHIVRWREADGNPAGTRFEWDLFALGGTEESGRDPNGEALTADNVFGCPDGLWIDRDRRVWIQTDAPDTSEGAYAAFGNNMMLTADPATGEIRRFLTGPIGQEITGVITTPDQTTMFVNVQHPGAGATSAAAFARGELASRWPGSGTSYPRSATVAITKDDGGKIGT